ncbi:MAG: hypothetical protein JW784_05295 [Candidatus Cloacimonetes bacterium]|nr:hypothetical protein [Candidatus Cloacimonadota bacterium]
MKKLNIALLLCLVIGSVLPVSAQDKYDPNQQITITKTTPFTDAIRAIELMTQQYEGKKIVNLSNYNGPIQVPIKQLYWKEALQLIIDFNQLVLKEQPGAYRISDPEVVKSSGGEQLSPDTKQVRISAIFFKLNETFSKNVGIDWSTLINGEVKARIDFKGAGAVADDLFQASVEQQIESGEYTFNINTLLRIIEAYQEGTIMARPNVIVLSGKKGFIQVGEDFSIKTIDKDGNTVDQFFETGIILEVTPTIIQQGENEAIHLVAKVEKSTAFPGAISTIISKSTSKTEILLYDGEETVIGGLYDTDISTTRRGIPILKDLPWWVFGIRYLTGFNKTEQNSGELIIILKVEILEPIEIRREQSDTIKDRIEQNRKDNRSMEQLFDQDLKEMEKQIKEQGNE